MADHYLLGRRHKSTLIQYAPVFLVSSVPSMKAQPETTVSKDAKNSQSAEHMSPIVVNIQCILSYSIQLKCGIGNPLLRRRVDRSNFGQVRPSDQHQFCSPATTSGNKLIACLSQVRGTPRWIKCTSEMDAALQTTTVTPRTGCVTEARGFKEGIAERSLIGAASRG
uniref:Uncharacterized protein n=1 Tax=Steinernema glaseri TaxID=37863 RepID=A0A1I7Y6C3_9BILA